MNEQLDEEIKYLNKCLEELEVKLNWGSKEDWTNYHFKQLSDDIAAKTSVTLSTSSIRRILGLDKSYKEKFNPQFETKNALAKYLGYENWSVFKEKYQTQKNVKKKNIKSIHKTFYFLIGALLLVVFLGYMIIINFFNQNFYFEGRNLIGTAPLTIAINYDISKLFGKNYQIDFREDMNPTGQIINLSKKDHIITHTFYNSYVYNIKLFRKEKIYSKQMVIVKSNGWEGGAIKDKNYYVIPKKYLNNDDSLYISSKELALNGVDTNSAFETEYKIIDTFPLFLDNCNFMAKLRFIEMNSNRGCYYAKIRLIGISKNINICLTNSQCTSNSQIEISDNKKSGTYDNLSLIIKKPFEWNSIKIKIIDKKAFLFINEELTYQLTYNKELGRLLGIHFKISGIAKIDDVEIRDNKNKFLFYTFNN